MNMEKFFIGVDFDEGKVVNSQVTQEQINRVKELNCKLQNQGELLNWETFDDPSEPRTIFQAILRDRQQRVDKKRIMADRPNFAVITAEGNDAVRLEYYEGHDYLIKRFDIRSKELENQKLKDTYRE